MLHAQTGDSKMSWELTNTSGDIVWFASSTSGTIDPFGEVLVQIVTQSTGLGARATPYVATFLLHSDDVCVCRDQSVKVTIELVVTAETSAANSYVELLGSSNAEASGAINFNIAPVDEEGVLIQDSGAVHFSPVLTWVGDGQATRRTQRRTLTREGGDDDGTAAVVVVCSVKYLTALDKHIGTCGLPTRNGIPLAGSFSLSVELASGELVGGSEYGVEVTSCPEDWFYHKPSGACVECDLDKSVCRGGKELPVPMKGYWSDLENAELGYVFSSVISAGATTRDLFLTPP